MEECYLRRLAYCKNKLKYIQDREYWVAAVQVYEHLILCNKNHTERVSCKKICTYKFEN